MGNQRELPIVMIKGTEFHVDVIREEFREKGNESNKISFSHLQYKKPYYSLAYDESTKNVKIARPWEMNVKIDELVKLDPVGMAEKYNIPVQNIGQKNDCDLRIYRPNWANRVVHDILPVIDIAGVWYDVDLKHYLLRLKDGFGGDIELKDMPELVNGQRYFYYNPSSMEVLSLQEICEQLPYGTVKVSLPADEILDPVAVARRECHDLRDYIMKHPIHQVLKAKVLPVKKEDLLNELELNKKRLLRELNERPLLTKNRESNGKDKGYHF
jgi:hypothetical protein